MRAVFAALFGIVVGSECSAGGIHGDVAAAYHDNPLADCDFEAPVHVDQKLDGFKNTIGVVTFDIKPTAERGADAKKHCIVAFTKLVESYVSSKPGVVVHLDAKVHNGVNVAGKNTPIESILGNTKPHGATEFVSCFVDGDLVAPAAEVVRACHASGSAADNANALGALVSWRGHNLVPDSAAFFDVARLGAKLLGDESFERPNRNWSIDLAPTARVFARSGTHSAAH